MKNSRGRCSFQFVRLALALLFASIQMLSQANTGRILGSVTDQTGGAISGATVTVTDSERGTTRTLTTDESGAYDAPSLIPGTVRGEYRGFKAFKRQNIVFEGGKEDRIDLELQPGEQTEKVTVTEAIPLVETTNSVLGGTPQITRPERRHFIAGAASSKAARS